jgi:hypothetical protein
MTDFSPGELLSGTLIRESTRMRLRYVRRARAGTSEDAACPGQPAHAGRFGCYPILNHTVFRYAGSARLMGKSGGCGT